MTRIKPKYYHPDYVLYITEKRIEKENKRLWLSLQIEKNAKESLLVILKNPSRATKDFSDKTVFNVTNYIYKNKHKYSEIKDIGTIIIINLIPFYETYADKFVKSGINIIDEQNQKTISALLAKHKNVIVAWGNPPKGLYKEYEKLKQTTLDIFKINRNKVFYVDKLSKSGNPKHGQVWSYKNELLEFKS